MCDFFVFKFLEPKQTSMFKFVENESDNKIHCIKDSNVELSATFNCAPEDLERIIIEW